MIVFLVTASLITTIAVPRLNRSKMHALETAAIKRIQTIHTAQTMYQSQFGRFATSLMELARADDLIDRNLASGVQGGYKYVMVGTGSAYTITAVPIAYNSTGSRAFYSDQTMQIRQDHGPEPATAQSPEVGN